MTTMMTTNVIRSFVSFPITDFIICKQQILDWANQFSICCFFDNHNYASEHNSYECVFAAGAKRVINTNAGNAFDSLKVFYDKEPDWLFGHLGYDLKNEVENLDSSHDDHIGFPDLFFFVPEYIIRLSDKGISINSETELSPEAVYEGIKKMPSAPLQGSSSHTSIRSRFTKQEYIDTITKLKAHILKGDCYEINFCQEFYADNVKTNPVEIYRSLQAVSPNPFSAFYKTDDKYLLCASPERYIKKIDDLVISQPIKGTWVRDLNDEKTDAINRQNLYESDKDRAENVMVVDLVRNDLSKICEEGSVQVDELYGIYSFPHVHQMISTISGRVSDDTHWTDIIRATFPMGSMTGAPKKMVMQLIEKYERSKRGIFSGAVGYISPEGDFDFNVVIRSILLNTTEGHLSYQVGSAITYNSDPEMEYEECMIKAAGINKVLS